MTIGDLLVELELVGLELVPVAALLLLPLLLQAARTPAESTAAALSARQFLENQGRWGLTPGASFLLVWIYHGLGVGDAEPIGDFRVLAHEPQARGIRLLLQEGGEVRLAISAADQTLD